MFSVSYIHHNYRYNVFLGIELYCRGLLNLKIYNRRLIEYGAYYAILCLCIGQRIEKIVSEIT